jgi:hypothetical protein
MAVDAKLETAAHTLQRGLENVPGDGCGQRSTAIVAAERHEVSPPGRVESFSVPKAQGQRTPENTPTQAKGRLEWATRPGGAVVVQIKSRVRSWIMSESTVQVIATRVMA